MRYNIYAGLSGGFGGCQYQYTENFDTEQEAWDAAHHAAVEEYQSYEGYHGLLSWDNIKEHYCNDNEVSEAGLIDSDYEEIDAIYEEEIESWLSYKATTVEEDPLCEN